MAYLKGVKVNLSQPVGNMGLETVAVLINFLRTPEWFGGFVLEPLSFRLREKVFDFSCQLDRALVRRGDGAFSLFRSRDGFGLSLLLGGRSSLVQNLGLPVR